MIKSVIVCLDMWIAFISIWALHNLQYAWVWWYYIVKKKKKCTFLIYGGFPIFLLGNSWISCWSCWILSKWYCDWIWWEACWKHQGGIWYLFIIISSSLSFSPSSQWMSIDAIISYGKNFNSSWLVEPYSLTWRYLCLIFLAINPHYSDQTIYRFEWVQLWKFKSVRCEVKDMKRKYNLIDLECKNQIESLVQKTWAFHWLSSWHGLLLTIYLIVSLMVYMIGWFVTDYWKNGGQGWSTHEGTCEKS